MTTLGRRLVGCLSADERKQVDDLVYECTMTDKYILGLDRDVDYLAMLALIAQTYLHLGYAVSSKECLSKLLTASQGANISFDQYDEIYEVIAEHMDDVYGNCGARARAMLGMYLEELEYILLGRLSSYDRIQLDVTELVVVNYSRLVMERDRSPSGEGLVQIDSDDRMTPMRREACEPYGSNGSLLAMCVKLNHARHIIDRIG